MLVSNWWNWHLFNMGSGNGMVWHHASTWANDNHFIEGSYMPYQVSMSFYLATLRPRQQCRHFPYDNFKCIFLNQNAWISMKISFKFVPEDPDHIPISVQIMAWRRSGAKPLPESMIVNLLTPICVTGTQWVKSRGIGRYLLDEIMQDTPTGSTGSIFKLLDFKSTFIFLNALLSTFLLICDELHSIQTPKHAMVKMRVGHGKTKW